MNLLTPRKAASREELMTAPPGLYELPERKTDTVWDISTDQHFEAELRLVARVRPPGLELPRSVEGITVRPDGGTIIFVWEVIPGTERNYRPTRQSS